jgi:hypothetical protein
MGPANLLDGPRWQALVAGYYRVLDESLETLADKREGKLSELPGFALTTREIEIGITPNGRGVLIKVTPREDLSEDQVFWQELSSPEDIARMAEPFGLSSGSRGSTSISLIAGGRPPIRDAESRISPDQLSAWPFIMMGDITVQAPGGSPLLPPVIGSSPYLGFGRADQARHSFEGDAAKEKALELWNNILAGGVTTAAGSFVETARGVFGKFAAIVKRKAFLERRIHRFLNDHSELLLPPYVRCFFEHKLVAGNETRRADFILQKQAGFPALLIELESPVHGIFRADGHLTAEANHAVAQIADWVRIIDSDSVRNASHDLSFLGGPKDRLVVIGRGLEDRKKLLQSRFSGTTVWSYELLLEQARARWNNQLVAQQRLLRLPEVEPF